MNGIVYFENEYGIREVVAEASDIEEAREIIREELDIMGIDPVYIREFKTNSGYTKFDYGSQYEFFVWEE